MESRILSRRDIEFMIFDWLDASSLLRRDRFEAHSEETFRGVLELSERMATEHFAPHNRLNDVQEPKVVDGRVVVNAEVGEALSRYAESGLIAGTMDSDRGGFQLPELIHRASFMWFQAANIATISYAMLTIANARLLLDFGSEEIVERYVSPMLGGRFAGTMCLSEPHVGSSLGDLTTRATRCADGSYRLRGTKMWISAGEHELNDNIIHLVLARTGDGGRGTKGLSLFVVPKFLLDSNGDPSERNDIDLVGINHKMGYRGTVNTELAFGSGAHRPLGEAGAVGFLVGEEGQGLAQMFHMMNEARVGVGSGAAALGYTGYLHALDYARQRRQGRELGTKDPQHEPVPIARHPDVRRMLLASKCYAEGATALVLYGARLQDDAATGETPEERRRAGLLLDVLTPVIKSWPSQWCLVANDLAIQILGGTGYTRDAPVEQFYRDNRLNPIHEGTHGIQGLDLLGRKVRAEGGAGFQTLLELIRSTSGRACGEWELRGRALARYADRVEEVTEKLWASGSPSAALSLAAVYLEVVGHVVVAWAWLDMVLMIGDRSGRFFDGKRLAAKFFFDHDLPRVDPQLDLLASGDLLLGGLDDGVL